MMATAVRAGLRRPGAVEALVVLAPILMELVLLALPPLGSHAWYWDFVIGQSAFALAPLAMVLTRRSWISVGLSRSGLAPSLALGVLLALVVVVPQLVLVSIGVMEPGTQVDEPSRFLGLPLASVLYVAFWGIFEGVWMCYLLFAVNRWLGYGFELRWRSVLLAVLWFAFIHAFTQAVGFGAALPQVLVAAAVGGVALLIPAPIPKITGNAWGLVLWFTVTNLGMPAL